MIVLKKVEKLYAAGMSPVRALDGIDMEIGTGEFVSITGPSGCGKSTLLNLLGGLDHPTSGEIFVDDLPLHEAGEKELTYYRRHKLGIVFQFFNLLPTMTVQENVELPLLLQGVGTREAAKRAAVDLALVGMEDRAGHFPHQLSGGQMQRAAIARAISHRPALLLADEPTGNLDSTNAEVVLETLATISKQTCVTILLVTHSREIAARAVRSIRMKDGRIQEG